MTLKVYNLDTIIDLKGNFNGKTVKEVLEKKRSDIMKLIKKGFYFDDEVLKAANITRTIRDVKYSNQIVNREKQNNTKHYKKDTLPIKQVLEELSMDKTKNIFQSSETSINKIDLNNIPDESTQYYDNE